MYRRIFLALALLAPSLAFGQATTPYVAGSADTANRILSGELGRIVFIGDSVTQGWAQAPYLAFSRLGIKGYGQGQRWASAGTNGTCFTGDTTVNDFADPLDFGGWVAEIDFGGGTSDASDTSSANRMLYNQVGPASGSTDAAFSSSVNQTMALGTDFWGDTIGAGRDITVKVPVYMHPDGPQNDDLYITIVSGSTRLAQSDYFSCYAVTPHWEYVEIVVPDSVATSYTFLQMEVRFRANTASESGKTAYVSAHASIVDETLTEGQELHMFCQGGASVDDFNNEALWSDESVEVLGLIDPDAIFICLGLNDSSSASSSAFTADLETLVGRVRAVCPHAPIVFVSPHARLSYGATYGGEGPEPYFTPGAYAAQQATRNALYINMTRMLPNIGVLTGQAHEAYTDWTNGDYIWKGAVVEDSGNLYVARQGHFKTGTAPGSDNTNWVSTAFASIGTQRPNEIRADRQNYVMQGDGVHPHINGGYLELQTIVNGLMIIGYQQEPSEIAAEIVDILDPPTVDELVQDLVEAGAVATPVDADVVDDSRTWFATGATATNIVTVNSGTSGTFAMKPKLNPNTGILSITSVSVTGAATVTATDFQVNRDRTKAHFDLPTLSTTGTYTVTVTVLTVDDQTIVTKATLRVQ